MRTAAGAGGMGRHLGLVLAFVGVGLAALPVAGGIVARGEWIAFMERWAESDTRPFEMRTETYVQGWLESQVRTRAWLRGHAAESGIVLSHRVLHGPIVMADLAAGSFPPRQLWAAIETVPVFAVSPLPPAPDDGAPIRAHTALAYSGEVTVDLESRANGSPRSPWIVRGLEGEVRSKARDLHAELRIDVLEVRDPVRLEVADVFLQAAYDGKTVGGLTGEIASLRIEAPELDGLQVDGLAWGQRAACVQDICDLSLRLQWAGLRRASESQGTFECQLALRGLDAEGLRALFRSARAESTTPNGLNLLHVRMGSRYAAELSPCRLETEKGTAQLSASLRAEPDAGSSEVARVEAALEMEFPVPFLHGVLDRVMEGRPVGSAFTPRSVRAAAERSRLLERLQDHGWLERDEAAYRTHVEFTRGSLLANGRPVHTDFLVESVRAALDALEDSGPRPVHGGSSRLPGRRVRNTDR